MRTVIGMCASAFTLTAALGAASFGVPLSAPASGARDAVVHAPSDARAEALPVTPRVSDGITRTGPFAVVDQCLSGGPQSRMPSVRLLADKSLDRTPLDERSPLSVACRPSMPVDRPTRSATLRYTPDALFDASK